jgi:CIC family chloride channel protein
VTVVLAGVVGICAAGVVLATDRGITLLGRHVFGSIPALGSQLHPRLASVPGLLSALSLAAVFVFVAGILRKWCREAQGTGIGQVMSAVGRGGGFMRKRVIVLKPLATALCIGAGAPLGLEGPVVQTGAAIGSLAGRRAKMGVGNIRVLVAAGAAAGLAAKYGAPIGGAVFSAELILGRTERATLLPLIVASFLAVAARHMLQGPAPEYVIRAEASFALRDYALFLALGLAAGLVATYFIKLIFATESAFLALFPRWWTRAAFGGLAIGLVGLVSADLLGTGKGVIQGLLDSPERSFQVLLAFVLLKPLLCSVALGSGVSGGVFAPSLFAGAALGAMFAAVAGRWLPVELNSTVYVLAGMAAVVAAVMRAPLQAILIAFELTHNYSVIPVLMLVCAASVKLSETLEPESAFTWRLARDGEKLRKGMDFSLLNGVTIGDIMHTDFVALPVGASIMDLGEAVKASENTTFPVVTEDDELVGIVMLANLIAAGSRVREGRPVPAVEELLEPDPVHLTAEDGLYDAWEAMGNYDYDCLPVCRREDGRLKLLGVCEKEAIIELHDREAFIALTVEARAADKGSGS